MKKGKGRNSGLLPSSLRIISSCLKTVSSNATTVAATVRSSVAASISSEDHKDQVTWAGFDRLQLGPFISKRVLLLGYQNGFQVLDVEDASNFRELVSKRDGPVSFLQMQPFPETSNGQEGFRSSHPLLLVVAGDDTNTLRVGQNHCHLGGVGRDVNVASQLGNCIISPTSVRFYSLRTHCYVHILRFRSAVHMVRCSPRIVAVGLATQIYCVDALTLENKFSVLTYPIPQLSGQGPVGVNMGYGPMAVGHRWLAFASNNPLVSNFSRLSPQNLTPGVSPSTSPSGTSLVARYAMESSKQLAAGIINLGDMGYKTLSRYYQELLPDGSNSPVSSSSGWKFSRSAGTDVECVGTVIVKDFVSRDVISQFKAHTSPISALCFDPSGTLLVTASVNGNNINVFRIMPSCTENAAGVRNYDWSSSHVHLYKLRRGMTSAMIQDICFSHYSQWIAIVSSKGTCHVFVLSPFGGDPGFQSCKNMGEEPSMHPLLTLPWWYTSDFVNTQHCSPPPPPVSLSVVSRIKYSSFGWLNATAGNANGVAAGKVFVPSGAVAAIFHNSTFHSIQQFNASVKALEHLLVYTPSGHVVQHELLPSIEAEGDNGSRTRSTSFVHLQEDDLKVKVEPVQWWDVCRRSDWPEREECISGYAETQSALEVPDSDSSFEDNFVMDFVDMGEEFIQKKTMKPCNVKFHESSHLFLSNAEVQISTARVPIWQKSKIFFHAMHSFHGNGFGDGELEIESVPFQEIEIKRKELLPVFDHFHSIKTCWNERGLSGGRCTIQSSVESHQNEGKVGQETVICHSNPASRSSTGSSECGSSRRFEHLLDLDHIHSEKPCNAISRTINDFYQERIGGIGGHIAGQLNKILLINDVSTSSFEHASDVKAPHNHNSGNELHLSTFSTPVVNTVAGESMNTNSKGINDISTSNAKSGDFHLKIILGRTALPTAEDQIDLGLSSSEAACKALEIDEGHDPIAMTDAQVCRNDGKCEEENPVEDGEVDDFLGGMFAFSEDG